MSILSLHSHGIPGVPRLHSDVTLRLIQASLAIVVGAGVGIAVWAAFLRNPFLY